MRIGIAVKIGVLSTALVAVTAALVGRVLFLESREILL